MRCSVAFLVLVCVRACVSVAVQDERQQLYGRLSGLSAVHGTAGGRRSELLPVHLWLPSECRAAVSASQRLYSCVLFVLFRPSARADLPILLAQNPDRRERTVPGVSQGVSGESGRFYAAVAGTGMCHSHSMVPIMRAPRAMPCRRTFYCNAQRLLHRHRGQISHAVCRGVWCVCLIVCLCDFHRTLGYISIYIQIISSLSKLRSGIDFIFYFLGFVKLMIYPIYFIILFIL